MHRAAALLSVVCVMAPAFAGESLNMREYEERCANYYAQEYGISPALVRAIIQIHETVTGSWCGIPYWLDIGNSADSGQFVLGQPLNRLNKHKADRLRAVSELF